MVIWRMLESRKVLIFSVSVSYRSGLHKILILKLKQIKTAGREKAVIDVGLVTQTSYPVDGICYIQL